MRQQTTMNQELLRNFVAAAAVIATVAAVTFAVMMLPGLITG
jgi:hypothetical protein